MSAFADELAALYKRFNELTRRQVVDAARDEPERFPALHADLFERFTDSELADQRRLDRAGEIIRSITIVFAPQPAPEPGRELVIIRQFVSTVTDDNQHRYMTVEDVGASPELVEAVLKRMQRDVAALETKYAAYASALRAEFALRALPPAVEG